MCGMNELDKSDSGSIRMIGPDIAPRDLIPSWRQIWTRVMGRVGGKWWSDAASQLLSHQCQSWVNPNISTISVILKFVMSQVALLGSRLHIRLSIRFFHLDIPQPYVTWPKLNHVPPPNLLDFLFQRSARFYPYRVSQGRNFSAIPDSSLSFKLLEFSPPLRLANSTL